MSKFAFKNRLVIGLITFVLIFLATNINTTNAADGNGLLSNFLGVPSLFDFINTGVANLMNLILMGSAMLVSLAGYILNVSIVLTLHIKDFVTATPAVYTLWRIIRDITGLFFIFYILYAAIMIMTQNSGAGGYGKMLKDIVIAGILINFSFFITSVAIDASNVVSQAIYNAMIPNQTKVQITQGTTMNSLVQNAGKGQISDIFMNSLKIQTLYDPKGNNKGPEVGNTFKIILIGVTGTIMMITTSASFIIGSLAFIARFVVLIFLLAFSSIWFAADIIPQLKDKFNFWSTLKSQLIFMPIYLLLMYAGLTILNESNIIGAANVGSLTDMPFAKDWIFPYAVLGFNFTIVIIMLNAPLIYALKMGGMATDKLSGLINKWSAKNVWGNVGTWTRDTAPSAVWKNTGGRAASVLAQSEGLKNIAARSGLGGLVLKGVRGAASSYDKKLESQVKARTDFANSLGYDEREVKKLEKHVRELYDKEREARAAGRIAEADMYKQRAELRKKNVGIMIANKKKERQADYAKRIGSKGLDLDSASTLWTKVARKNKVAAAKINIDVWQKQLDKKKEDLKELKRKLEVVERDIRNDIARTGQASRPNADEKTKLEDKIDKMTTNPNHNDNISDMGVDDLQDKIDEAKMIK